MESISCSRCFFIGITNLGASGVHCKFKKISCILFLAVVLVGLVITGSVFTGEKFHIDQKVLQKTQEKHGKEAVMHFVS